MNDDDVTAAERRLLNDLRLALGPDEPPPGLVDRAEALLAVADLDRDLAELLEPAGLEPAGLRGAALAGEPVLFEVLDGSVRLEVTASRSTLRGQVVVGSAAEVVLERLDGPVATAAVDQLGRFRFDGVAAGPARLRMRIGWQTVRTDWFLL